MVINYNKISAFVAGVDPVTRISFLFARRRFSIVDFAVFCIFATC